MTPGVAAFEGGGVSVSRVLVLTHVLTVCIYSYLFILIRIYLGVTLFSGDGVTLSVSIRRIYVCRRRVMRCVCAHAGMHSCTRVHMHTHTHTR